MTEPSLRGVCIGAGYFSHFQYEAWNRIPEVDIVAFCNRDAVRSKEVQERFGLETRYTDYREMLDRERPDFVDVITPPGTHAEICAEAGARGIDIICQKPLAPTLEEAQGLVDRAKRDGVRLMVHENFRFQPWHRKIKGLMDSGILGERLHSLSFRTRTGDGWGEEAYIPRQPYFREYPRLLVYETGIHFIDTFRYLGGEIARVTAWLRKLNPVIQGEDCGLLVFEFENGAIGQWDANRYNEPPEGINARYTFGEFLVEGDQGSVRLGFDGSISLQRLGDKAQSIDYQPSKEGFAGDCVYATQRSFIDHLQGGDAFETSGEDYLRSIAVQEAIYTSAQSREPVAVQYL